MRPRSLPLLLAPIIACALGFPSTIRAQDKREVATKFSSHKYLFFLGEKNDLDLEVPEKAAATDVLVQVKAIGVKRKFTQEGVMSFLDMKLECEGITYTVPAHKVVVMKRPPTGAGFHIATALDPNDSGNVELLITYQSSRPGRETVWMCDIADRPKGIKDVSASGELVGSEGFLDVILRNTTDTPYTLKPEFFKNLPTVKDWPEIVLPPTNAK